MLVRDTKEIYRFQIEKAIDKDASARDVLDYLFGENLGDGPKSKFVIREWTSDTKTPLNRINMVWATLLTLFCSPYQYIANGQIGWDTKTTVGRFILRVTGHLKET